RCFRARSLACHHARRPWRARRVHVVGGRKGAIPLLPRLESRVSRSLGWRLALSALHGQSRLLINQAGAEAKTPWCRPLSPTKGQASEPAAPTLAVGKVVLRCRMSPLLYSY